MIYYRITLDGSEKYVKSNSDCCEIYQKSPFGNRWMQVDKPYPIWDEHEYERITEDQFIRAIANIDFESQPRLTKAL